MDIKKEDLSVSCEVKGKDLFLLVKNNSSSPIIIDTPCTINTYIKVKRLGREVNLSKRVKPSPECTNRDIMILAHEEKKFTNPYGNSSLTDLYRLESDIEYEIEIVFYPTAAHLQNEEGIKSSPYFFTVH